jgi:hypothetical protein
MIDALIDKVDTSELIRDKIADILVTESASQVAIATLEGKPDPSLWALRVYVERANPFEEFLNDPENVTPVVNVWFDSASFDMARGNVVERQMADGVFNVDCYGYAASRETVDGHAPGDRDAAIESQRAARLARNILMAAVYTYLGLRGLVGRRWVASIKAFQPAFDSPHVSHVVGVRVSLAVVYNELAPQVTGEIMELVQLTTKRAEDGAVILVAEYPSTGD